MSNGMNFVKPSPKNMTDNHLAAQITRHLTNNGVKVIELPGGSVQLHGKHGTIMLTTDISTLRTKHIEKLCGVV